ncbi:hypothetical protein Cgig2_018299 [Carnegiea gigantea]|uniref:Uncharacterized protein n=1 Tax=Carnegiea gigantea TaxID=171969 RepID=A0A9Q1QTF2_9CARY|nr:hypothetical protein Cgig2_018299 [Carnegiea gigantea]
MTPCISLSYLSTSALVYFNFVINTLVFSNSNPFLRLISLSSACVMVSAFVQLMRASYKCGRRCGAVFCGHDRVQTYGAIFTSRQVKEPILRSLKPQKSPAVQEDRSGYFGGRGDLQAGGLCIAPCQSANCAAGISVSVCLKRALDHLLQPAKTFAAGILLSARLVGYSDFLRGWHAKHSTLTESALSALLDHFQRLAREPKRTSVYVRAARGRATDGSRLTALEQACPGEPLASQLRQCNRGVNGEERESRG